MEEKRPDKIQWHPAFFGAVELEFRYNKDDLEFIREYHLSKEALRMDMLILKIRKKIRLKNEIGHMFKKYNVLEYKCPDDGLTIDDLYKTLGYAFLYKGLGSTVDAIPGDELTVTLLREEKVVEFFTAVKQLGATVEKVYNGIYYIHGICMIDIQLVIFEELDEEQHSAFRILSKRAKESDVRRFLESTENIDNPGDRANMDSVLDVSIKANKDLYNKLKEEYNMCQALRELMRDEFDAELEKITNEVTNEVKESERISLVKALMESANVDVAKAMDMLQIPENTREALKEKIGNTPQ